VHGEDLAADSCLVEDQSGIEVDHGGHLTKVGARPKTRGAMYFPSGVSPSRGCRKHDGCTSTLVWRHGPGAVAEI
jgi:hypothetical protein